MVQVPSQPLCTSETPCCKITLRNSRPCAAVKDGRFYDSSPRRRGPELQEAHTPSEAVSPAQGEPRAGLERRSRGARALGQVLFIYLKQMALTSLTKSFVLFVHRNEIKKKKTKNTFSLQSGTTPQQKSTPNFFSGGRLLHSCDKTVTSGEESTRARVPSAGARACCARGHGPVGRSSRGGTSMPQAASSDRLGCPSGGRSGRPP